MFDLPPWIIVISCLTQPTGTIDQNSKWTGYENREWAVVQGQLQCKAEKVDLTDESALLGAPGLAFNSHRCSVAAISYIPKWDEMNRRSDYRAWRVACPRPKVDLETGEIVGFEDPDCPPPSYKDKMVCRVESEV